MTPHRLTGVQAVVTMHGNIKRSDGANNDPPPILVDTPCSKNDDCADREFCVNGTCRGGGTTVFSAGEFLGLPSTNYTMMQTGVLGGHLRIASVACLNPASNAANTAVAAVGFEMLAVGPLPEDMDTILIAIRKFDPDAAVNASFQYVTVSLNQQRCTATPCVSTASRFYAAVLAHAIEWEAVFAPAMDVTVPYTERRQVDMAKGVLVAASTVWIGDEPNYGTGGDYWRSSPPRRAMMDTSGVAGSLPLTSLSLDTALLQWGVTESALSKIGFYVDTFIFPNGTIDMGHWKDQWVDGGDGVYNCMSTSSLHPALFLLMGVFNYGGYVSLYFLQALPVSESTPRYILTPGVQKLESLEISGALFTRWSTTGTYPDGLSDHGRVLQMFCDAVRYSGGNTEWMTAHFAPILRIGQYLLKSRAEAVAAFPTGDPRHGLVYGPAEHDTCTMGMGTSPPVYDGQLMLYYFSTSMWHWRGMLELGQLLLDYPQAHSNHTFAQSLLAEAPRFKADIDAAMARSVVRRNGTIFFVPAAVAPANTEPTVYPSMTNDVLSSYSNFR